MRRLSKSEKKKMWRTPREKRRRKQTSAKRVRRIHLGLRRSKA